MNTEHLKQLSGFALTLSMPISKRATAPHPATRYPAPLWERSRVVGPGAGSAAIYYK